MIYEIYSYSGGEYIIAVLNATVRVLSGNSFITAIKIFLLFGMFGVFFDIAINGNFSKGIKYYVSFLLAYNILFLPKVDVLITDPIREITSDRKVDDVPFGIAIVSHTVSTLGDWMTKTFGMNFVLPTDLQYHENGLLFGNTLLQRTLRVKPSMGEINSNFNNYIIQCIYPSIQLERISFESVLKSSSLDDFLKLGNSGILAYEYISNGNKSFLLCNNTEYLNKDLTLEVQNILKSIDGDFNGISEYLLGINSSSTELFEQSIISNAISDSTQNYLSFTGANAGAVNYATTKDDIQRKNTGVLQWIQASKYLPLLKITIEALFYALFPIVILMTMLPDGFKYFKNYCIILLALQLWSPLYAVLNLIMTLEQKFRISSIINDGQITLYTKQAIMDVSNSISTQAGLIALAIPSLAYKIVSQMQGVGEVIASGVANAGAYSTGHITGEISGNGMSYGNGSMKNISYNNISGENENLNNVSNNNVSTGNESKNNVSSNQFKVMQNDFRTSEDQVNSSRIALNEAKSTRESNENSYNKSLQKLENFTYTDSSGNGKTHSFSNSDTMKGGFGFNFSAGGFKIGADYEKMLQQADQNNISQEDRKTLTNLIQESKNYSTSYNNSVNDEISKQKSLNYNTQTSSHSGIDWQKPVYNHLKDLGYSDEYIFNNPQEAQKIGKKFIEDNIFNQNKPKMLDNANNSLDTSRNQYNNQNNMIDNQYNYQKNDLSNNKQLHQMKNTDFSILDFNIKRKDDQ